MVDFYRLLVQGADLGGVAGGLKGSGTVEIRVLDINDNVPTLQQTEVGCTHSHTHTHTVGSHTPLLYSTGA